MSRRQSMRSASRKSRTRTLIEAMESRLLLSYVPVSGLHDLVYDSSRNVVYATTTGGTIQRYDVATGQLLAPWNVGGNPLGADITPDNAFLYVADYGNTRVLKVDLNTGTATPLPYTASLWEGNAYDVAVVGSRAIFTTDFKGTGTTPLRNIDLATGTIAKRTDLPTVRQRSILSRAADGSALFLTESIVNTGPIHLYNTAQDKFTIAATTHSALDGALHDVSRDGKLIAMNFGGLSLYDQSLNGVLTLSGLDGGLKFDPSYDMVYAINSATDQLIGFDTAAMVQRFALPLGRDFSAGTQFGSGMMAVGANKLFVSDGAGILALDLPQHTGQVAQLQITGYSTFARQGVAGTLHVQALDPAGFPATGYRGTVTFSSSDPAASLPGDYTFTAADQGSVDLPVTLNTVGTQTITVHDTATGALTAQLTGCQVHAGNVSLIPVTNGREHVFDPQRNRLYITTSRGVIERYDLATETLLEPLAVGGNLYGIDISADGHWLLVQDGNSAGTTGQYLKIDLNLLDTAGLRSNYLTRITYSNSNLERGGWDVVRTARGTFAADGQAPSGSVPVRDIDPATNAIPTMPTFGSVHQNTGIGRSSDGRYLIYTDSGVATGPVTIFDTQTNQVVATLNTNTTLSGESGVVNPDGSLFAIHLGGTRIYDRSLQLVTTLSNIDGGAAFDPVSLNLFYGVDSSADQLVIYRTTDWSIVDSVPLGENFSSSAPMGSGIMSITTDGSQVYVSSPSGIRVLTLHTRANLPDYTIDEGQSLSLVASAVPASGATIATYEWDFDYDGTTFTTDATGSSVNIPTAAINGPATRRLALRVTDSRGGTAMATDQLTIRNVPPTATFGNDGPVNQDTTATVSFSTILDPSPADTAAGFTYSYDFDNDGTFEITGSTLASVTVPASFLATPGQLTVRGRIQDQDGGFTDYTTAITVVHVPHAPTLTNVTPLTGNLEDQPVTIDYATLAAASDAADRDGDVLSFRIDALTSGTLTKDGLPVVPGSTLLATGESLIWTPDASANGALPAFTVSAWDGQLASATPVQVNVLVTPVNSAPSFIKGANLVVNNDAGAQTIANWATAITAGAANEAGQTLTFQILSNSNPALFTVAPALAANGTLTFTPAPDAFGSATITVQLQDSGGTANGGQDTSTTQTFTISTKINLSAAIPVGYVDTVTPSLIGGWAGFPISASAVVSVYITIDGHLYAAVPANTSRPDLVSVLHSPYHGFNFGIPSLPVGFHSFHVDAITGSGGTVRIGQGTFATQNTFFSESYYLATYADVAAAVRAGTITSGYAHFVAFGQREGRNPNPYYVESYYLANNPDVAAAVRAGRFTSGWQHFSLYGHREGRRAYAGFDESYYLATYPDVAAAVRAGTFGSGYVQFILFGDRQGYHGVP